MENKSLVELAQQLSRLEKSRDNYLSKAQEADEQIIKIKREMAMMLSVDGAINNA